MENFTPGMVLVIRTSRVSGRVVSPDLVHLYGRCPDSWTSGAQIVHTFPLGWVRRYLFNDDSDDLSGYRIALSCQPAGKGMSKEINTFGLVGWELDERAPITCFGLPLADCYPILAGGIYMVLILSMIVGTEQNRSLRQLTWDGLPPKSLAFAASPARSPRGELMPASDDAAGHPQFDSAISDVSDGFLICCFDAEEMFASAGKCRDRFDEAAGLYFKGFTASKLSSSGSSPTPLTDIVFGKELVSAGFVLKILTDGTFCEVIREVFPDVLLSALEGHCGMSATAVFEERPDHGYTIPTSNEQGENSLMMICVGGSSSFLLVLGIWAVLTWMVLEGGLYRGVCSIDILRTRYSRWEGIVPAVTRTGIICNN